MSHRSVSSFCIVRSTRQGHTRDRGSFCDLPHDRWSGSSSGLEPLRRLRWRRWQSSAHHSPGIPLKMASVPRQYQAVSPKMTSSIAVWNCCQIARLISVAERGKQTGGPGSAGSQGRKRPLSGGFPAVSGQRAHAPDRPAPRSGLSGLPRDLGLGNAASPALTLGSESTKTGATRDLGGLLVTRSGRSSLRRATIAVLLGCAAMGLSAPAFAQGPAPEPAPPSPTRPKPEPRSTRPEPPPPARRATQPTPPPPPASPSPPPAASPPPPASPQTSQTFVQQPPPPAPPPAAPVRRAQTPVQRPPARKTPKKKRVIASKPKQTRVLPRVRATVAADSPDTMLLVGGFALFVLVLGDTIFLTLSARFLREAGG